MCSCFINYDTNLWTRFKRLQNMPYTNDCKLFEIFQKYSLENYRSIVHLNDVILTNNFAIKENTLICMHFLYYFFRFFPNHTARLFICKTPDALINCLSITSIEINRIINVHKQSLFSSVHSFVSKGFKIFSVIFIKVISHDNDYNISLAQFDLEFIKIEYADIINKKIF